ncbi:MAG: hypothetical protein AABX04_04655 [Nanoarchaeota archaeon]
MRKIYRILLATAFITSVGFGVDYGFHKFIQNKQQECAERIIEIEKAVESALTHAKSEIYIVEGMQFSAGGGYFYLPKGMDRSEQERKEISDRIKVKESVLYDLEKRIGCVFHPKKKVPFYCPGE